MLFAQYSEGKGGGRSFVVYLCEKRYKPHAVILGKIVEMLNSTSLFP